MKEKRYSLRDNVRYMFANWKAWDKKSFIYLIVRIPCQVVLPLLTALAPKIMIDCIQRQVRVGELLAAVGLLSLFIAGLSWLAPFMQEKLDGSARTTRMRYAVKAFEKSMATDFVNVESLSGREKMERSREFYFSGNSGGAGFYDCFCQMAVCAVGIAASLALLFRLHPLMILIIAATCAGEFFLLRLMNRAEVKMRDSGNPVFVKFRYFNRISRDFSAGKDIRIYSVGDWFLKVTAEALAAYTKILSKYTRQALSVTAVRAALNFVRELIAYGYLVYCVWHGTITVSDFIFYFGIVTGFSGWVLGLIQQYSSLERCSLECEKYREYLSMGDTQAQHTAGTTAPGPMESIEFQTVYFSYESAQEPTIKNMNFKIMAGENIAIVGENGSGKTTAIKLLCGLYRPTEGCVLLNGKDVSGLPQNTYFSQFSVVFQEYYFLPMSVAMNIALCKEEEIDWERLRRVTEEAGILQRVQQLPQGFRTNMVKEVYPDAADFSGGEKQKLLLARALYKEAPVLILDEPTAALDPISENELYLKYKELTQGKTSFFISHRLSSTRFCDRILFFADGRIAEMGTHDELMAQKGHYFRMFQLQSYYYREGKDASDEIAENVW